MIQFFRKRTHQKPSATPEALAEELATRGLDLVYRYVSRRVTRREDVEDLTSEILLQAAAQVPRFRGDGPVEAWLYRIAQRTLAGFFRRSRSRRETSPLLPGLEEALPGAPRDDPARMALQRERAQKAREILEALPADQREVLLLKYLEGLSQEEIGRVIGRSPAAVNSLLQRARKAARQRGESYFLAPDEQEVRR
ncbi:MAG: RNA polymerase sigma factor [Armatimonadota bacterium]